MVGMLSNRLITRRICATHYSEYIRQTEKEMRFQMQYKSKENHNNSPIHHYVTLVEDKKHRMEKQHHTIT